jgi:transcriptional regulator with XRE-family HTH domain
MTTTDARETADMRVAGTVTRLCHERQVTHEQLSYATGIAQRTLSRKLASGYGFTMVEVEQLAAALGVSLEQFFADGTSS